MGKFKLTEGRKRELVICDYFVSPRWKDFRNLMWKKDGSTNITTQTKKVINVKEDENGVSAEEGYFSITERGKKKILVNNIKRFLNLWWGRIWADRTIHEIWEPSLACHNMDGGFGINELWHDDLPNYPPQEVVEYTAKKICGGQHKKQILERYGKTKD
jgi:hypothetical protein